MKKSFNACLICICIFLSPCQILYAQLPGVRDSIYSQSLKEQRVLQVQLPTEYKPGSADKYEVLYLLDGEWNSGLMAEVQAWSKQWGFTPPIIIVGIVNSYANNNNQRERDLTPTGANGGGGGPAFLSFIKSELIPYINKTYPTNGSNILFGHSLGGLFVLYTLFSEPDLFESYVAADPSIWWDNGYLLRLASERLPEIKKIKSLFITGRPGRPYREMKIDSMEMLLQHKAPANLLWKTVTYPDETHISQQYKSAYDGLKFSLAPLLKKESILIDPMGGIIIKDKPFNVSCNNILPGKYMRYTLDGTEPALSSSVFNAENKLALSRSTTLKIKSFFSNEADDKMLTADFIKGKSLAVFTLPPLIKKGSLNYTCYKDPASTQPISSGIISHEKNINELVDSSSFYCRISGYLETVKAGYYIFEIRGEKGSKLWLGDKLLMEVATGSDYRSYMIPLEKGFYPIRFEYSHVKGVNNFDFSYVVPGAEEDNEIPSSLMYYVP